MKNQPNLKKNFVFNSIYQIITILIPLVTAPYLSRVLQPEGVGIQSFTASVQMYFSLFGALGTSTYGERAIAQARDDVYKRSKLFWEIELLTVCTSSISILIWVFVCIFGSYHVLYLILTMNIVATAFDITWFFTGLEQFPKVIVRNLVVKISSVVLVFLFIHSPEHLTRYILIHSGMNLLSSISLWTYVKKLTCSINIKEVSVFSHFKNTFAYFVPTIAISVYTIIDKIMIGVITKDSAQNGYYEQAEKVIALLKSAVFTTVNTVVSPRASYLAAGNQKADMKRLAMKSLDYIFFAGIGCVFGVSAIATRAVPLFFGSGYEGVVTLLYILCPIVIIIGISSCLGTQYYTPQGLRPKTTKYIIAGSISNFTLNIIMIPLYGAAGAAIASIIAELIVTILYMKYADGFITVKDLIHISWKKMVSGTFMFMIVITLGNAFSYENDTYLLLLIQIMVGVISYLAILYAIKDSFTRDVLMLLHKKIR